MGDNNVHLIIAAFQGERDAETVLRWLKTHKRNATVDAAVLSKDGAGNVHVKATPNIEAGIDIIIGCFAGALLGIMVGPIVWDTIGGFVIGALLAVLYNGGFPIHRLRQIGVGLKTGSSAIIYVIDHPDENRVEPKLQLTRTEVTIEALAVNISSHLEAGNCVSYSAITSRENFANGVLVVLGGS